jgi:hypothetical protein
MSCKERPWEFCVVAWEACLWSHYSEITLTMGQTVVPKRRLSLTKNYRKIKDKSLDFPANI